LSVLFGLSIPLSYPLYAEASAPLNPKAHAQDPSGTLSMNATASSASVTGSASLSPAVGALNPAGSAATTQATIDNDGNMTVTADVLTKALDLLGGVIRIGSVHTHTVTTFRQGDPAPKTTSTTTVEAASVAGVPVSIGTGGVQVLGQSASNPLSAVDHLVNTALKAAGISMKTTSLTPQAGGEVSSALEIDDTQTIPVGSNPKGTLTMLLGTASTSITLGAPTGSSSSALGPPAVSGSTGASTGSPGLAPAAPTTSGGSGTTPTAAAPILSPSSPSPARGTAPRLARRTPAAGPTSVLLARDLRHTWRVLYVIFVLGAITFLTASVLWRTKGVHPTWIS
jgi:hypothetical protein